MEDQMKKLALTYVDNMGEDTDLTDAIEYFTELTALNQNGLTARVTLYEESEGEILEYGVGFNTKDTADVYSILLPFYKEVLACLTKKSEAQKTSELLPKTTELDEAINQARLAASKAEGEKALKNLAETLEKESAMVSEEKLEIPYPKNREEAEKIIEVLKGTFELEDIKDETKEEKEYWAGMVPIVNLADLYNEEWKRFREYNYVKEDLPLVMEILKTGEEVLNTLKHANKIVISDKYNKLTLNLGDNDYVFDIIRQIFILLVKARQALLSKV